MFKLWSNAAVCEFSGPLSDCDGNPIESPVLHQADSDKIIEFWERASDSGSGFRWALTHRHSGVFAGTAGFNSLGTCSEYAYHLHPDYWQRGYMSEATAVAFDWLRNSHRSNEIEVFIAPLNVRSIAFAERHEFQSTGEESDGALRYLKAVLQVAVPTPLTNRPRTPSPRANRTSETRPSVQFISQKAHAMAYRAMSAA